MLLAIQVRLKLAVRALFRGGRNLRESLRQGQDQNFGFQTLSILTPFKCWNGKLGLVRDFMVSYILMSGTETQLIGHISVPHLLGFFRCLECPWAPLTGCYHPDFHAQSGYSLTSSPHCVRRPCQGAVGWKIHFCLPMAVDHPTISALLYPGRRRDFTVKPEPGNFTPDSKSWIQF